MTSKHLIPEDTAELSDVDFVRSEVNLLVFPFFALTTRGLGEILETEFRAVAIRGEERIEVVWNVSANPKYGYPGLFDRDVHRAIEQIITQMLGDQGIVQNPIPIGSFYSICERMGLEKQRGQQKYGGWQYRAIRRALERIGATTIKSEGTFYHKGERRWVSQVFHLYDAVVLRGERLRDGTIAETNYLYLSDLYLQSLNSLYVKPIDYQYQRSLRSHIASRLYEILGVKFYAVRGRQEAEVCFRYSTLVQLLPVERHRYLSDARKQLNPAHKELVATGFLASYEWRAARGSKEWVIAYRPGPRARDEIQRAEAERRLMEPGQEPLPGLQEELEELRCLPGETAVVLSEEQKELLGDLVSLNVSEVTARQLVTTQDLGRIREWLEAIRYVHAKDKAAFLVKAVQECWQLPEEYLRAKEQEECWERQRRAEQVRLTREQEAEKQQQRKAQELDRLYESLPPHLKAEVDREAEARVPPAIRERMRHEGNRGRPSRITKAVLRSKCREVVKEWLEEGKLEGGEVLGECS